MQHCRAPRPIFLTELGMEREVSALQFSKARAPMLVKVSGSSTVCRTGGGGSSVLATGIFRTIFVTTTFLGGASFTLNAPRPIASTPRGTVMRVRPLILSGQTLITVATSRHLISSTGLFALPSSEFFECLFPIVQSFICKKICFVSSCKQALICSDCELNSYC